MKHLILKKEIQLGKVMAVPETTKMPLTLSELVNYMSFPTNKFALLALSQLFKDKDKFIQENFNTKFSADQLLVEAGYSFKHTAEKDAQKYLEEVEEAWTDFLRKMKSALMNVRYRFLEQRVDINPSKLYQ
ncbi:MULTISPECIES: hypothetical protein [unclassified Flammeovirga]|uniref:hypothetical protein n=1 Tax=unclassified Flammeovirga TaxID=2637820 RepID=UPI000786CAE9|nr:MULTISPECIES: hypothetical protein [unclassified Flammeovirga]KXX69047.1 hypothetical protein AVL50_17990 [Flammeovirga sp. SJP92]MBD0402085.1 hypothetical protein [Flammeovirga sp. EKP202]